MQITKGFCDTGVLMRLGYRTYGVHGGLGYDACERIWYTLQLFEMGIRYNEEYGVTIVYAASDYRTK